MPSRKTVALHPRLQEMIDKKQLGRGAAASLQLRVQFGKLTRKELDLIVRNIPPENLRALLHSMLRKRKLHSQGLVEIAEDYAKYSELQVPHEEIEKLMNCPSIKFLETLNGLLDIYKVQSPLGLIFSVCQRKINEMGLWQSKGEEFSRKRAAISIAQRRLIGAMKHNDKDAITKRAAGLVEAKNNFEKFLHSLGL